VSTLTKVLILPYFGKGGGDLRKVKGRVIFITISPLPLERGGYRIMERLIGSRNGLMILLKSYN